MRFIQTAVEILCTNKIELETYFLLPFWLASLMDGCIWSELLTDLLISMCFWKNMFMFRGQVGFCFWAAVHFKA